MQLQTEETNPNGSISLCEECLVLGANFWGWHGVPVELWEDHAVSQQALAKYVTCMLVDVHSNTDKCMLGFCTPRASCVIDGFSHFCKSVNETKWSWKSLFGRPVRIMKASLLGKEGVGKC